jgi:hypothetical protein
MFLKKAPLAVFFVMLLAVGSFAQVDLDLTTINFYPEKSDDSYTVEILFDSKMADHPDDVDSGHVTCSLSVNGSFVAEGSVLVEWDEVRSCPCIMTPNYPTCDLACIPSDYVCVPWHALETCWCVKPEIPIPLPAIVLADMDMVSATITAPEGITEYSYDNNFKEVVFETVPSLTEYGILVLALLLIITAIWVMRRRSARAVT